MYACMQLEAQLVGERIKEAKEREKFAVTACMYEYVYIQLPVLNELLFAMELLRKVL